MLSLRIARNAELLHAVEQGRATEGRGAPRRPAPPDHPVGVPEDPEDVRGNGDDGRHAVVRVGQSMDEVQIVRAIAPGTYREPPTQLRLSTGGERRRLLVLHVYPLELPAALDRIGDRVEAVPHTPVNTLHPRQGQPVHQLFRHRSMYHWSPHLGLPNSSHRG